MSELRLGDQVQVCRLPAVPADGIVGSGDSEVDEAMVIRESVSTGLTAKRAGHLEYGRWRRLAVRADLP